MRRINRRNDMCKHAQYLNLGIKDPKEWKTCKDRLATKEEVAMGMKEAEVYVKALQEALTSYTAPWMDQPYEALDKQTEGVLLRGWAQTLVGSEDLDKMAFRHQHMSQRQWDARISEEKKKILGMWTGQDRAYMQEMAGLRAAREATASK